MAVTGVLKIEYLYDNHILEAIRDQNYLAREIAYSLKAELGRQLADHFYADHREFFIWFGEVERFPKSLHSTVFVLAGILLLKKAQDCEIGETWIASDSAVWLRAQEKSNGMLEVPILPELAVSIMAEAQMVIPHYIFRAVKFRRRDDVVYAWERVS